MSEWVSTTLGKIFAVDNTKLGPHVEEPTVMSLSKYAGFVRADEYFDKRIASSNLDAYKVVELGEWAFSTIHIDEGSIARNNLGERGVISPMYTTMRFVSTDCIPEYAELLVRQPGMLAEYSRRAQGSINRRRSLPFKAFAEIVVALPSKAQQRSIVEVIAAMDAQIAALGEELIRLGPLRVRLFLDSDDLDYVAVDRVASVSQGKALPKRVQGEHSGDVSWFKIADMTGSGNKDGYTRAETRLTLEQINSLKGVVVPAGSVVFPRVGAAVLTEKKRILDVDAAVDENHLVLTPREGVSAECLLAAVESIRLAELVQTGAVPSLNMGLLRSAQIPWSIKANDRLNDALCEMRASTRGLRAELADLHTFRSALMTSLLNQEIEIPESYNSLLEEVS